MKKLLIIPLFLCSCGISCQEVKRMQADVCEENNQVMLESECSVECYSKSDFCGVQCGSRYFSGEETKSCVSECLGSI